MTAPNLSSADNIPGRLSSTNCHMMRTRRRLETLQYFTAKMAEYPPDMHPLTLNLELASIRELMDEVIRIAVVEFNMLSLKMSQPPTDPDDRADLEYLMAKHIVESVVADRYLGRLEEMLPNMSSERLQRVLRRREVAVWKKYKLPTVPTRAHKPSK